ncbi:lytic transglycosylase domain-containing protein, partial [Xanthovirga aplysinae]|uniref:lytic transglycosylase domain-containing protein n=1 Tax=Xanthovirga aplysinae TaxID=2529853 RepID=UPI0012BD7358
FTIKEREYTRMVIQRSHIYFPLFEKYIEKYQLPDEIKFLAIIESGLVPNARSRVGAVGLWQFMPTTGRAYKLHQDWYIDERMDPDKATEAACIYLKQLYGMFGDWELALAAYNCGPGNVRKAIRRSGNKKSFWEVYNYLPRETRSYVPQLTAMVYVMNYLPEHNLYEEAEEYILASDTIHVSQYLHLKTLAEQIGLCPDELQGLNPAIRRGAIPDKVKKYPLRIPVEKYDQVVDNRLALFEAAGSVGKKELDYLARNSIGSTYGRDKVVYKVRRGDVLGKIARKYRVRVADLRKWNNIRGNMIRIGQRLSIWVNPSAAPRYGQVASNRSKKPVTENINGKKYHYVQPGDTLWDIAKK